MRTWKTSGITVLILYILTAIWIWVRNVDGAGVVQTLRMKEITSIIWLVFAIPIVLVYLIWYIVLKRKAKREN